MFFTLPSTTALHHSPLPETKSADRKAGFVLASGRRVSRAGLFLLLHWGGWLAFGAIPFAWTVSSWGFWGALVNNALFVTSGALLSLMLRTAYRRARNSGLSYAVLAPSILLACGLLAEAWYLCDMLIDRWSFQQLAALPAVNTHFEFGARALSKASWLIDMSSWFVFTFALLTWSSLYFAITSVMSMEYEKARAAHALKLADQARLSVLQAQLNPHFLFNSLNGVATLIREQKGAAAETMVSTLSDFLRATLRTVNMPEITVSEEMVFVDQYIELQQLRFDDRLSVTLDVREETFSALLPTLMLQPLVENAVQHGVLACEGGGGVNISIARHGAELRVCVEDDGPGASSEGLPSFGVGLTNTAERLHALYGSAASMSIGRSTRGGFSVVLRLPFRSLKKRHSKGVRTEAVT
jgi:two-component system LytT family sensor kinase